jgi:hypothetical protein
MRRSSSIRWPESLLSLRSVANASNWAANHRKRNRELDITWIITMVAATCPYDIYCSFHYKREISTNCKALQIPIFARKGTKQTTRLRSRRLATLLTESRSQRCYSNLYSSFPQKAAICSYLDSVTISLRDLGRCVSFVSRELTRTRFPSSIQCERNRCRDCRLRPRTLP